MMSSRPSHNYGRYDELTFLTYGLGWFVTAYRGHPWLWHTGGALGMNSLVSILPRENIGLVILTNMQGSPLRSVLMYNVYDRLLGLDQIPWTERLKAEQVEVEQALEKARQEKDKDRRLNTSPSHPLEDYTGDFFNPGYGTISIEKEGNHLKATYNAMSYVLSHYHYDIFEAGKTEISGFSFKSFHRPQKLSFCTDFESNIHSVAVQVPFASGLEIVFVRTKEKE